MTREDRTAIFITIGFVVLAVLWFADRQKPAPMSPETRALADSVDRTKPAHDSAVTRLVAFDSSAGRADSQLARAARASQRKADEHRHRADSLAAAAALATDSATAWRQAYEARTAEAEQHQVTIDTLNARVDTLTAANDSLRFTRDSVLIPRVAALERLELGLRADLKKATECKIVGPIRCPTRKEVAVVSLSLGFYAASR